MNRLEKRFQKNADELRKVDLDFKELKTAHERNIQIVEKQNQLKNEYESKKFCILQMKCYLLSSKKDKSKEKWNFKRKKKSSIKKKFEREMLSLLFSNK